MTTSVNPLSYIIKTTFPSFTVFLLLLSLFGNAQERLIISQKGTTLYTIYIDVSAPLSVQKAAKDLQLYLGKATGASPEITTNVTPPASPFISLGNTTALKGANLSYKGISNDGFKIISKGKNLYIYGPDTKTGEVNKLGGVSNGTANGVYTFLEEYVGIRWLMPGEPGEYIPKKSTLTIPVLNRTESSPFDYRHEPHIGTGKIVEDWTHRLKLGKVSFPQYNHAWEKTIPASAYDEHPTWFAQIGGKHLPPAERYKLETTNPELVQAYADTAIARFTKDPDLKWYSLSPSDGVNGEAGWSDSPEAVALLEKDPFGKVSRTRIILKFYNDVAKIVGAVFPDRKLGGYIYANYFYPPKDGIPKLEPNLALMLATHVSYGFQLYRPATQANWEKVVSQWGESARKNGFDLYYYDLPTAIMQHNGIVMPPAPDILNFIFSRLLKYGFKGAYVYGRPVWPVFGASNYAIAKLKWNPNGDAHTILREYYDKAYGTAAAPYVEKLYGVLDSAYRIYYLAHPEGNYNLSPNHLKEIYGPTYPTVEKHYLTAWNLPNADPIQRERLRLFGEVLSTMQWNLRSLNYLPATYASVLTKTDEEVDQLLTENERAQTGVAAQEGKPSVIIPRVVLNEANTTISTTINNTIIPTFGSAQLLLHVPKTGNVTMQVNEFNGLGEFVRFMLYDNTGTLLKEGGIRTGRKISFDATAGETYILDMPNRRAGLQVAIEGAIPAYKTNRDNTRGFRIELDKLKSATLPLYLYVPAGTKEFGITMSFSSGVIADVYAPDGTRKGELNTTATPSSRFVNRDEKKNNGFWKIVVHKPSDAGKVVAIVPDEHLPQWFLVDPTQLLEFIKPSLVKE